MNRASSHSPLSRRAFLRLSAVGAAGALIAACAPAAPPAAPAAESAAAPAQATGTSVRVHHASWAGPMGNQVHYTQRIFLDRLFDLKFVGTRIDPKNVLIMFFSEQAGLLGQADIVNQIRRFVHPNLSASLANASLVMMIFWN